MLKIYQNRFICQRSRGKRPRDTGEDDKEALAAHIEALFADLT